MVVTGRGLGAAPGDAAYDIAEIGRDRLAHSASNRLEDILRDIPGFQQFRRSDSRSANPTSQGATLRALGGNASSRALLLLDGVPQTDPFGGWLSWPAYDPRRLGRVRVTRGGGSGVNGPGALAGTIELESAAASEGGGFAAGLAYGSRDSVDAYAGYGARLGAGLRRVSRPPLRAATASSRWSSASAGSPTAPRPYAQAGLAARAVAPLSRDGRAAGQCLRLQRPARARHGVQRDRDARRGCLAAAGRARASALLGAGLCPAARFRQRLRLGERGADGRHADARPVQRALDRAAARGSSCGRGSGRWRCGSAATGAIPEGGRRSCSNMSPARRPAAGSPAARAPRSAPSPRRAWRPGR